MTPENSAAMKKVTLNLDAAMWEEAKVLAMSLGWSANKLASTCCRIGLELLRITDNMRFERDNYGR